MMRVTLTRLHGSGRIKEVSPPLGVATLAAHLLRSDLSARLELSVLDLLPMELDNTEAVRRIAETEPDVVGLSYLTVQADDARTVMHGLRRELPHACIVTGWSHSTALPEAVLADGADVVVQGEGEAAFERVLSALLDGRRVEPSPGVWVPGGRAHPRTSDSLLPGPDLPPPAWHLLDLGAAYNETAHFDARPALPVMASRGCAFDCSFCGSKDVWLRKVRFRRVEDVVREIEHGVHVLGFERFHFYDDDFLISRDYARELCERIISAGLRIRWVCLVTVWALLKNRELLPLLRKAGCAGIEFGFESADLSVLRTVGKRQTPDEIIETIRLIREAGFEYMDPLSMIFNEGETPTSQRAELALFDRAGFERQKVAVHQFATPYPGTAFGERAERVGTAFARTWSDYRSDRINFIPQSFLRAKAPKVDVSTGWVDLVKEAVDWEVAADVGRGAVERAAKFYEEEADSATSVSALAERFGLATGIERGAAVRCVAVLAVLAVRHGYDGQAKP